jgi:ESS family glutamate:Na+ symporter
MVAAGIAAIRMDIIGQYWAVLLSLGVVGLVLTYSYNYFIARKLFPTYCEQQFMAMYGMLTGTASTGVILLREIDGDFKTPVADNLVYQNFPAMIFGFPILLLATMGPDKPYMTLGIIAVFFVVMNIALFRSFIFRRKESKTKI